MGSELRTPTPYAGGLPGGSDAARASLGGMTEISIDRAPGRLAPIPRPAVMAADFTYLVLGLPLGIAAFTLAVTGLALSAGLAITLAGVPVLVATLLAVRAFAAFERKRARVAARHPDRGP